MSNSEWSDAIGLEILMGGRPAPDGGYRLEGFSPSPAPFASSPDQDIIGRLLNGFGILLWEVTKILIPILFWLTFQMARAAWEILVWVIKR